MLTGTLLIILGLMAAVGGYFLKQHLYTGWDKTRIGAVDNLFSARRLLSLLTYLLFHVLWFFLSLFLLIMGLVSFLR